MDYKRVTQFETFLIVAGLGIFVRHDSYQMFLAIASAILAFFLACLLFRNKLGRFVFFLPVAVVICQLSVTIKRAVIEQGFGQTLQVNPIGTLFADVLYGFRHVVITIGKAIGGFTEVITNDTYSTVESMNYRFFTIIVMIVLMTIFILKKESSKRLVVE